MTARARRAILIGMVLLMAFAAVGAAQEPFTFVQVCDPQLCRHGCEHDIAMFRLAVDYINVLQPDFVLICGDLTDMVKGGPMLQEFLDIKSDLEMPCYCVVGNNDVGNTPDPVLLEEFRQLVGPDWFSFNHKGFKFVGVNTQIWRSAALPAETAAQDAWLELELDAAHQTGTPVIVGGHYPLFLADPSEPDSGSNLPPAKRNELLGQFQDDGVVAYLAGHIHGNFVSNFGSTTFVTTASTCGNYDSSPLGFRLWHMTPPPQTRLSHEYLALAGFYDLGRDSDNDGIPDAEEDVNRNNLVDLGETNRNNPDTDGDGIPDGTEITLGLDPLIPNAGPVPAAGWFGLLLTAAVLGLAGFRRIVEKS